MAAGAVLVTGASSGIGKATALRLDRKGWRVFAGVRLAADGERLRQEASGPLRPVLLDVTDEAMIASAADMMRQAVGDGGLAVVNNAGVAVGGPVEYVPLDEWRRQLEVNVVGQIAVTRAALPLIRSGGGRIVFMGSISGRVAAPLLGPYSASKFALLGVAETLRHELDPWGIKVIVVEPGATRTPIWEKGRQRISEADKLLPAAAFEVYGHHLTALRKAIDRQDRVGIPAEKVAAAVERALTAERPKARYLVGTDAVAASLISRLLPDSLKDGLLRRLSPS